jgi:hypothetical protein
MFLGEVGDPMPAGLAIGPWSACALLSALWLALGLIVTPSLSPTSPAPSRGLGSYGVITARHASRGRWYAARRLAEVA